MKLLGSFSVEHGEIGLSELARMTHIDKAATRRLLVALGKHNFIEQNSVTRAYRLGSGFLRLAHIRELNFPINKIASEVALWLSHESGESAHISVEDNGMLRTIAHREPNRGTIVHLDPSEMLPMHATASGLAFLGFSSASKRDAILVAPLAAHTASTITDPGKIRQLADKAFQCGFAESTNGFEDDAAGIAVPFFGDDGCIAGTVAVAAPSSRMNTARRAQIKALLFQASVRITDALGGTLHANVAAMETVHG